MTLTTRFYTDQQLGEKQSLTPEGFLVCHDVPIARIGELLYVAGEIPLEPGPDGLIRVERHPEDVFAVEALASFSGKPVTNDHPPKDVTPANYRDYARGSVQNVRAGEGPLAGCVVADLLITDAEAIADVRAGKREVSCGYDAEYQSISPGRGVQRHIVGNHVALVERGRCGPRCSIGDHRVTAKKQSMAERFIALLEGKAAPATTHDDEGGVHLHLGGEEKSNDAFEEYKKSNDKRFDEMGAAVKSLADSFAEFAKGSKDEGEEEAGDPDKSKDAEGEEKEEKAKAEDSAKELLERAEILAPGSVTQAPKYAKGKAKAFADAVCACKRAALDAATKTTNGKAAVTPFLAGHTVDKLPLALLDAAFIGASELARAKNNAVAGRSSVRTSDFGQQPKSVDAISAKHREFWTKQH